LQHHSKNNQLHAAEYRREVLHSHSGSVFTASSVPPSIFVMRESLQSTNAPLIFKQLQELAAILKKKFASER